MATRKQPKAGKLSPQDIKKMFNKATGHTVAWNLNETNPTAVKEWIPTGSRWLDSIICKGKLAGIPVGKITEIAGLESTGKSFMAGLIAANAQKQGKIVVYFDSESAIDPQFLERLGCDLDDLIYVQAVSVEKVFEYIEMSLSSEVPMVFILDSFALTPAESDLEGDFNPLSSMAVKARVTAKGLSKLVQPLANGGHTFLVLNQLKTNITRNVAEALTTPYTTPGGKALIYAYSLRIWLTGRKAKASFITDDNGFRIGSEVKVKLEKSRFGTQGRQCTFKILWGDDDVGVQDVESWFDALIGTDGMKSPSQGWYQIEGFPKFQRGSWMTRMEDPAFMNAVLKIMDEEVIRKFKDKEGSAESFYDVDEGEDE